MTQGISPKVQAFLAAVGGPGLILLVLGLLIHDDTLRVAGITALCGAVVGGAAGGKASPGEVITAIGQPSDEQLSPATTSTLNALR